MQSVRLHIRRDHPPPRCAREQLIRPHQHLPGLQRQSFDTPPPQRVTGVSNQEDVVGAEDEEGAAGRRLGRTRSTELQTELRVENQRREREKKENHGAGEAWRRTREKRLGFLKVWKKREETWRSRRAERTAMSAGRACNHGPQEGQYRGVVKGQKNKSDGTSTSALVSFWDQADNGDRGSARTKDRRRSPKGAA